MTITQLSNIFNLIVQNDPDYNFYHYGWPSDMNLNIQNNSDPLAKTGRLFPYVLLLPPTIQSRAMESNTASIFDTYSVEFLITDTYAYNQGVLTYKNDTTIEIEQKLQVLAKKLVQYFLDYSAESNPPFNVGDYNIELDPYRFSADTRSIRVRLNLVFPAICDDANLDISFLPTDLSDIDSFDYEANLNYCPNIGLSSDIILGAGRVGPVWSAQASLFDFVAEINAHPKFVGGLNIIKSEFTALDGGPVGLITVIGNDTYCDNIPLSVNEIIYNMSVSADFNTGAGVHTLNYTLTVNIFQPVGSDDYSTNNYICNDEA